MDAEIGRDAADERGGLPAHDDDRGNRPLLQLLEARPGVEARRLDRDPERLEQRGASDRRACDTTEIEQAFVVRPTGVGRALATFEIPIEGRDEWLAAARRLA